MGDKIDEINYTKIFINNKWQDSVSGETFPIFNPTTGEKICLIQKGEKADIDLAVEAARQAFKLGSPWRTLDASKRGELLFKLADLIEKNFDELAKLETLDVGKTINESKIDIADTIKCLRYYAGWADKIHGKTIPMDGKYFAYTRVEPIGVCGQIIPWNYPILMVAWKIGPALCTGNTVVMKPAEQAPLTTLYVAHLTKEAGFPPGVFNVVPGFGDAGAALVEHLDVDKIAFTGSTEVGQLIQKEAGNSNTKRVTLEMGGKSPLVILDDADIDLAAKIAQEAAYNCQGQCCSAAGRIFVQEAVYDMFVEKCRELSSKRITGDPFNELTVQGPQIDETQMNKILSHIDIGKKEGAKLETGGRRIGNKGYFIETTVFSGVTDDMTIAKEEIFGPVMQILKFKTLDEVIERSNRTKYGLAAGIFTNSIEKALHYTQGVQAGTVWVNDYLPQSAQVPFGGFKMSGQGRELGEDGLKEYLEIKSVVISIAEKNS